jgi:hypothetical protein
MKRVSVGNSCCSDSNCEDNNAIMKIKSRRNIITLALFLSLFTHLIFSQTQIDTIGKTTFDLQFIGPAYKTTVDDITYGIHTTWLHSLDTIPFSDLRMYYNFYNYNSSQWFWGSSGVSGYLQLSSQNVANLDIYNTRRAAFSGCQNNVFLLLDDMPAHGSFDPYSIQGAGYQYPILSIGAGGYFYITAFKNDSIYYSFSRTTNGWISWRNFSYAGYPSHNICASKNSGKVCVLWTVVDSTKPDWGTLYIKTSADSGNTWSSPIAISESIPSNLRNTFLGGYAIYDNNANLHIVTQTYDGYNPKPVEMWHYSPANNPHWSRIVYLTTDTLLGKLGYGAIYACRSSIVQCNNSSYPQRFFVVWEQFRWNDVDSTSGEKYLRADIYGAMSDNYGMQWSSTINLTNSIGINERYPNIVYIDAFLRPHIAIEYMVDISPGVYVKSEGGKTINPIICKMFQLYDGIEEKECLETGNSFEITPNPFSARVSITLNSFLEREGAINIYTTDGRLIRSLKFNNNQCNRILQWDGKDDFGNTVNKGIYFCAVKIKNINIIKKIIYVK